MTTTETKWVLDRVNWPSNAVPRSRSRVSSVEKTGYAARQYSSDEGHKSLEEAVGECEIEIHKNPDKYQLRIGGMRTRGGK